MALAQFSESNLASSVAVHLAAELLAAGYLVYWHPVDAVETPGGWYYGWRENFATYAVDPAVQALLTAAKGLVTLYERQAANPVYPVRHTGDGSVAAPDELQVPYLALEVGAEVGGRFLGIGDRRKWRTRDLTVWGVARTEAEQSWLRDALGRWLEEPTVIAVEDFDAGTRAAVGQVELLAVLTDSASVPTAPETIRHELIANAQIRYDD